MMNTFKSSKDLWRTAGYQSGDLVGHRKPLWGTTVGQCLQGTATLKPSPLCAQRFRKGHKYFFTQWGIMWTWRLPGNTPIYFPQHPLLSLKMFCCNVFSQFSRQRLTKLGNYNHVHMLFVSAGLGVIYIYQTECGGAVIWNKAFLRRDDKKIMFNYHGIFKFNSETIPSCFN